MTVAFSTSSYSGQLADFALSFHLDDVPPDVKKETLRIFLDCLGCAVAGLITPAAQIAIDFAKDERGPLMAQIIGAGEASLLPATFANAVLTNAIDYEVYGPEGHVCAIAFPVAVSVAHAVSASGRELLEALIAGLEIGGRVGAAIRRPGQGGTRPVPQVRGHAQVALAAAAAAGRLLHLTPQQMQNALGVAGYSATVPTLRKFFASPHSPMTKYDHIALMAQTGTQAAVLAQRGYTGDPEVLEGDIGLWRFAGAAGCDWDLLTRDFGSYWTIREVSYKPYPVGLYNNPGIDVARTLVHENGLRPDDIDHVEIRTARAEEGGQHQEIRTGLQAWTNSAYNVAAGIFDIYPRRSWQTPEVYERDDLRTFMKRIEFRRMNEDEMTVKGDYWEGWSPARVTIQAGGRAFQGGSDFLPKLDDKQLSAKFRDNVGSLLSPAAQEQVEQVCWNLDALDNVRKLCGLVQHG